MLSSKLSWRWLDKLSTRIPFGLWTFLSFFIGRPWLSSLVTYSSPSRSFTIGFILRCFAIRLPRLIPDDFSFLTSLITPSWDLILSFDRFRPLRAVSDILFLMPSERPERPPSEILLNRGLVSPLLFVPGLLCLVSFGDRTASSWLELDVNKAPFYRALPWLLFSELPNAPKSAVFFPCLDFDRELASSLDFLRLRPFNSI